MSNIFDKMYILFYILSRIFDRGTFVNATYKEISAWISAVVTLVIYGYYLSEVPEATTQAAALNLFIRVAVAMVVMEAILEGVASAYHKPEKTDERDRLISAKASRNASYMLMAGIVITNIQLLMPVDVATAITHMPQTTCAVHLLILTAAASEFLRFVSQIAYYRRGA